MTVAVAINRYLDIVSNVRIVNIPRLTNGYLQAFVVLLAASAVNAPRWLEFSCCKVSVMIQNVTNNETGEIEMVNQTMYGLNINPIRNDYQYIRDSFISDTSN